MLAVGYNRRFSSHARAIKKAFAERQSPISISYTVVAGPVPGGTWLTDPREGGGRIVGESCHFVDLCNYLVGAPATSVYAHAMGRDPEADDSMTAVLGYGDGSSATIHYLARANSELPKERFEVSGGGVTARCDNFKETRILGGRSGGKKGGGVKGVNQDKGQQTAVREVVAALQKGTPSPFGIDEIVAVSRATFGILESQRSGAVVRLDTSEG